MRIKRYRDVMTLPTWDDVLVSDWPFLTEMQLNTQMHKGKEGRIPIPADQNLRLTQVYLALYSYKSPYNDR